ncbi:copper(I)-binding protein [Sphaerotilus sulfidivorans]|uniref:Copper chaperone PCu(A)C n=1 Tax=Sphaerotilus sulfidivorans TaxID=639200 RepID=A0A5C1Q6X9_9BURK|nr:copper chaperone PCu(A)C [Sphaerotilus sulfidivorans]NZD47721.1 copper chaperone PCu(A)C [Sphaerotilus sulfidivorans]QEN03108.1 copper chaperone PCu(A)C [Sphaerotilus sulfidivorans]
MPAIPALPTLRAVAACITLLMATGAALAQVSVKDPWVRATVAQQKATGAFMQISSTEPVRLVEAKSAAARIVEIHEMRMDGDRMMMKAIDALDIVPGRTLELKPGSYHIMLIDVVKPVNAGDKLPLTLVIEGRDGKRSAVEVSAEARAMNAARPAAAAEHRHAH